MVRFIGVQNLTGVETEYAGCDRKGISMRNRLRGSNGLLVHFLSSHLPGTEPSGTQREGGKKGYKAVPAPACKGSLVVPTKPRGLRNSNMSVVICILTDLPGRIWKRKRAFRTYQHCGIPSEWKKVERMDMCACTILTSITSPRNSSELAKSPRIQPFIRDGGSVPSLASHGPSIVSPA
eukprot:320094-Pelagomonas_calceolata.AAC.3